MSFDCVSNYEHALFSRHISVCVEINAEVEFR